MITLIGKLIINNHKCSYKDKERIEHIKVTYDRGYERTICRICGKEEESLSWTPFAEGPDDRDFSAGMLSLTIPVSIYVKEGHISKFTPQKFNLMYYDEQVKSVINFKEMNPDKYRGYDYYKDIVENYFKDEYLPPYNKVIDLYEDK